VADRAAPGHWSLVRNQPCRATAPADRPGVPNGRQPAPPCRVSRPADEPADNPNDSHEGALADTRVIEPSGSVDPLQRRFAVKRGER